MNLMSKPNDTTIAKYPYNRNHLLTTSFELLSTVIPPECYAVNTINQRKIFRIRNEFILGLDNFLCD